MSLSKRLSTTYTPGVAGTSGTPGRPAIPAYCETSNVSQCQWVPNPAITYQWEWIPEWNGIPAHYDNVAYYNGVKLVDNVGVPLTIYQCASTPVTTCYPAQPPVDAIPAVPATPPQISVSKNYGWTNGRARSIDPFNIGTAIRFQVSPASIGVFVGLAPMGSDSIPVGAFTHGLMLDASGVKVYEGGVAVSTLTATWDGTTEFLITRTHSTAGVVTYSVVGGSSYTSSVPILGELYAYTAMYSGGDTITSAAYEAAAAATLYDNVSASFGSLRATLAEGAYEAVYASLPGFTASVSDDGNYEAVSASFAPIQAFLSEYSSYGAVWASFAPFTASITGDEYVPAMADRLDAAFPALGASLTDFTPGYEIVSATLAPFQAMLIEPVVYGEVRATLPAFVARITENANPGYVYSMESVQLSTVGTAQPVIVVALLDGIEVAGTFTTTRINLAQSLSSLFASSAYTVMGEFTVNLLDGITLRDAAYPSSVGDATVLVVNIDTGAATRYSHYGFREFRELDGKYYGVGDDGVYLLEGDDDAGENIDAYIDLGSSTFGSTVKKRLPAVYANVSSSGKMILKVVVDGGTPQYYEARSSDTDLHTTRFKPGMGLSGNNWKFVLMNQSGDDFSLASLEFTPVGSTRRI